MKFYAILFKNCFFDQITQSEDILPCCFCIIDEEVAMLFAHLHSSHSSSLESCPIDEPSWCECPQRRKELWESIMLLSCRKSIGKKRTTRKSCWLFDFSDGFEIVWRIGLVLSSEWIDTDECREDYISWVSLQCSMTIRELHLFMSDDLLSHIWEIKHCRLDEYIRHLDSEATGIPDGCSAKCPRQSNPRNQRRYLIKIIELLSNKVR